MSHTFARRSRLVSALVACAVVLAACGGGESTRTRNNALVNANCHASPIAKQQAIESVSQQIASTEEEIADGDLLQANYEFLAAEAVRTFAEYDAYSKSIDRVAATKEQQDMVRKLWDTYKMFLSDSSKALKSLEKVKDAKNRLIGLKNALSQLEKKPLCGGDEGASPDTSSSVDDMTTTSTATEQPTTSVATDEPTTSIAEVETSTTNAATDAPTTSVETSTTMLDTTTTENTTPVQSTAAADISTSTAPSGDGEPQVTLTADEPEASVLERCGAPMPEEGLNFSARVGEAIVMTIPRCPLLESVGTIAVWIDRSLIESIVLVGVKKAVVTFRSQTELSTQLVMRFLDPAVGRFGSSSTANLTFTNNDPCAGKTPDAEWDAALKGGSFTATSTCEAATSLRYSVLRKSEDASVEVGKGYLASGVVYSDLINRFGAGTYEVSLTHAVLTDGTATLVGDTKVLEIEYKPEPTESTTSTSTPGSDTPLVTEIAEAPEVVRLPISAFTPLVSEPVENPRAADPRVPVAAIPAEAVVMTCDQACIDQVLALVGVTEGVVEVSIGAGAWREVSASSLLSLPGGATNVRVRVTPTSGDPVVMSAVMTRESTGEATSELAFENVDDNATAILPADDGSSVPWWIVILIAVLAALAAAEVMRRRKTQKDATTV